MNGSFEAWKEGDCYLSVSNLWERISSDDFFALRARDGLKIALFCHDLAPIVMPHLYAERTRACFSWCLDALSSADLVICNSFFTQYELLRLMNLKGQSVVSSVVQLNAKLESLLDQQEVGIASLKGRIYVLSVSSINNRKNYELLLKLWSVYVADLEIRDVCLVIVGSKNWGSEKVFHRLELDASLSERVFHFSDVSENTLDWLYKNCLFTVYPSLYEGWGIPITESLSYGKVCVASSTSSMPEASSGLGVHIDPLDFASWKIELKKLVTDHEYRRSMEKLIQEKFASKDWSSVGKEIVEQVLDMSIDLNN
jgi:glycosyltransferase involved in cell wall biosynthesis